MFSEAIPSEEEKLELHALYAEALSVPFESVTNFVVTVLLTETGQALTRRRLLTTYTMVISFDVTGPGVTTNSVTEDLTSDTFKELITAGLPELTITFPDDDSSFVNVTAARRLLSVSTEPETASSCLEFLQRRRLSDVLLMFCDEHESESDCSRHDNCEWRSNFGACKAALRVSIN